MMEKLVYGKKKQVKFNSVEEKEEAIQYLLTTSNVKPTVEDNHNQGAWGQEHRFKFYKKDGVPACLDRQMTAGTKSLYGRINCKEFYEEVKKRKEKDGK